MRIANSVLLIVFCLLTPSQLVAQTSLEKDTVGICESFAKTWMTKADLFAEFEYSETTGGTTHHGSGTISIRAGHFRMKFANESSNPNWRTFDFYNHDLIEWKQLQGPSSPWISKISIVASKDAFGHPVDGILSPIGFVGGWNGGVVFGGLETNRSMSERIRSHFESGSTDEIDLVLIQESTTDGLAIQATIQLADDRQCELCTEFKEIDGWLVKSIERYAVQSEVGSATGFEKTLAVTDFKSLNGIPIPTVLTLRQSGGHAREVKFSMNGIRKTSTSDFDFAVDSLWKGIFPNNELETMNFLTVDKKAIESWVLSNSR